MSESRIENFNTQPLVLEIENVIKNGLNVILKDFVQRYDLLEKTHHKIMNLPSVKNELNQSDNNSDSDAEYSAKVEDVIISDVKKFTSELVRNQICDVESKLNSLEKKYDAVVPILDKILNKLQLLNDDVKVLKQSPVENKCVESAPIIKASIVSACENENIKFEIKESVAEDVEVAEEVVAGSDQAIEEEEVEEEEEEEAVASLEEAEEEDAVASLEEDAVASLEEEAVETEASDDEEESVKDADAVADTVASLEDEEEVYEIEIDDVTYFTNNDESGFIYEATEDEEVGDKVGYFKEGEPFFYADETK